MFSVTLLLLFFLPGASIILATFGDYRNMGSRYQFVNFILFSIAVSIAITVFTGTFLGSVWVIIPGVYLFQSYSITGILIAITYGGLLIWYIRPVSVENDKNIDDSLDERDCLLELETLQLELDELLKKEKTYSKKGKETKHLKMEIRRIRKKIEYQSLMIEKNLFN